MSELIHFNNKIQKKTKTMLNGQNAVQQIGGQEMMDQVMRIAKLIIPNTITDVFANEHRKRVLEMIR
jgi:hypothetical protein